ncbi:MAG: hypothetical protein MHM6MM_003421 [Cercozoa sp. M6MM]
MKVLVGSENPTKVASVRQVVERYFGTDIKHDVSGVSVSSNVSDQPMSAEETYQGAKARAAAALASCADADFGVGIEGGLEQLGDTWFESGYVVVLHRDGRVGVGTSARVEVSEHIVERLRGGEELCEVMDDLSGLQDVRSNLGMMGLVTKGELPRTECYVHGVLFAFAKFVAPSQFFASPLSSEI